MCLCDPAPRGKKPTQREIILHPPSRNDAAALEPLVPESLNLGASARRRVAILTKDEDFAVRSQQTSDGPAVVWLRVGNASNRALRAWLKPRLTGIVQLVGQGSRLVEVV
jgi:hypothetical protein